MSEDKPSASLIPVFIWLGLGVIAALASLVFIGLGVADSESAGVMAAGLFCPLTFAGGATVLGALVSIAFGSTVARAVVPLVAGMLGGLFGGFATMMFFAVLWPMM
ncbi:MAG: hypothetical protein EP330_10645 [Deltaproteobacteria bacterium]|nr:MAG: hypothetical protein EP330_10645 [Deltaproteobacteria bacterium]